MIKRKLEEWIKGLLALPQEIVLEHPAQTERGDFAFVDSSGKAEENWEALRQAQGDVQKHIEKIELVNGRFINIFLKKEFFIEEVNKIIKEGEKYGEGDLLKGEKLFIEHTQPNPFKEFHIGHLMNNAIGESVVRVAKCNGAEVKVASYHGDVGLHVAKAIWGKMQNPSMNWGESYAYGSQNYEENKDKIIEINKKIYDRSEEEINNLYDEGRKDSFEYFESLYKKLDSKFDFHFYESESGEVGKKLTLENVGKVFEESEGAVVFRGENFEPKTHTRVFLSKEELPTYEAKELGLAEIKKAKWKYDRSITVTANEQDSFFDVVEVAIGEVFPELKGKLKHLSHGLLKLPTGKMSSRTGDIISAEALINQVKEKVLEKIKDRNFSDGEKEEIAEVVAMGAIKFTILRQAIGGDIIFDFDKSISFEGDSGPYLQYTAVRANAVLEKAGVPRITLGESVPRVILGIFDLERVLYRFPEVVETVSQEYAPHKLVSYLLELSSSFNSFYANEQIIDPSGSDLGSPYKIALTSAVSTVLQNGLNLLGIKVPRKM